MNIVCSNCQRQFDVDESRLGEIKAALCDCGTRLFLGPEPQENTRLGKYDLIHKVATGGMGEIFYGKSSGIEGFEREVAIKRMLPHLSRERSFIDMMVKEAKLTVQLNHPNIVQIYDLSKQGEQYYIAMEYVPGITVGTILEHLHKEQEVMPLEVAVHITLQLLYGLGYAHKFTDQKGTPISIVHRDITPQNILVTSRAFVKITDFGIARAVNEISTTSPGMIKGKLGYIAPEQLSGSEPDHRVDLFCAGILLWEMLAVRRLFKGNTEAETFGLIAKAQVPKLDTIRQDVTPALWAVIVRSLDKDPAARYPSAEAFAEAINQAIFPKVASAFNQATVAYFQSHPQLFAGVYQPSAHSAQATATDGPLAPVKTFTRIIVPPAPKVNPWLVGSLIACGVAALGGGLFWASQRPAQAPPAAVVASAPAPSVAPALAPAAVPPAPAPASAPAAPQPTPVAPAAAPGEAAPKEREQETPRKRSRASRRERDDASTPLTGKEIQGVFVRNQSSIARCLRDIDPKTAPKSVAAHVAIDTGGAVSGVTFEPALPNETGACLTRALKALHFRKHPTEGLKITVPLTLQVL